MAHEAALPHCQAHVPGKGAAELLVARLAPLSDNSLQSLLQLLLGLRRRQLNGH